MGIHRKHRKNNKVYRSFEIEAQVKLAEDLKKQAEILEAIATGMHRLLSASADAKPRREQIKGDERTLSEHAKCQKVARVSESELAISMMGERIFHKLTELAKQEESFELVAKKANDLLAPFLNRITTKEAKNLGWYTVGESLNCIIFPTLEQAQLCIEARSRNQLESTETTGLLSSFVSLSKLKSDILKLNDKSYTRQAQLSEQVKAYLHSKRIEEGSKFYLVGSGQTFRIFLDKNVAKQYVETRMQLDLNPKHTLHSGVGLDTLSKHLSQHAVVSHAEFVKELKNLVKVASLNKQSAIQEDTTKDQVFSVVNINGVISIFCSKEEKKKALDFAFHMNQHASEYAEFKTLAEADAFRVREIAYLEKIQAKHNQEVLFQGIKGLDAYVDGSMMVEMNAGGYGIVFIEDGVEIGQISESVISGETLTSTEVELAGAVRAIRYAMKHGYQQLTMYYDCEAINHIQQNELKYSAQTNTFAKEYADLMYALKASGEMSVRFVKVKSHATAECGGHHYNELADTLAKASMQASVALFKRFKSGIDDETVRIELGLESVNPLVLDSLSRDWSVYVRAAVAENPNTVVPTLLRLAKDVDGTVSTRAVARIVDVDGCD